jgi:hypothetical protein
MKLSILIDDLFSSSTELFESGALFRETLENLFSRVREWIAGMHLEICTGAEGQFLIGDTPALTFRADGRMGAAIGDANSLILPLGPYRLGAIGPMHNFAALPREAVDHLNRLQVLAADRRVWMHPLANLESFVHSVRPPVAV